MTPIKFAKEIAIYVASIIIIKSVIRGSVFWAPNELASNISYQYVDLHFTFATFLKKGKVGYIGYIQIQR